MNPSTTDTVRLFFSSPGATTFSQLPVTPGVDVWPFFGTNTSNYVEVSFDDGLDGQYAGLWHLNESVTAAGDLDVTRSPDVSGYFNTAQVRGAVTFPGPNNGVLGKAAVFGGGWLEVPHAASLEPVNGITMELTIRPAGDPDCDGQNNYRTLVRKGEAYSLVFEESRGVRARVRVAGGAIRELYSGAVIAADGATWTKVTAEYDGATGVMQIRFADQIVAEQTFPAAQLAGTGAPLTIGGVGTSPACPQGGNFAGTIDEASVSRIARHLGAPEMPDAGLGPDAAGAGDAGADASTGASGDGGGCCRTTHGADDGAPVLMLVVAGGLYRRRRRRAPRGEPGR